RHVVPALWHHYDDCRDHKVVLSKEQWDYFQRLMLLLESDAHLDVRECRRWSMTQLLAGIALSAFVLCAFWVGFGAHLFAVAIPFGLASIGLSRLRQRSARHILSSSEVALIPFSSISELLAVRRRVPAFSKQAYPASLAARRIRSRSQESVIRLQQ